MMFEEWNAEAYIKEWTEKLRALNEDIESIELYMKHFKLDRRKTDDKLLYQQLSTMKSLSEVMKNRLIYLTDKYTDLWVLREVGE